MRIVTPSVTRARLQTDKHTNRQTNIEDLVRLDSQQQHERWRVALVVRSSRRQ